MVNYEKIKYDTTKSMNKTSTYRGTSQRAGLGGNRYEGLYGMDLGDARWKSDSSSCSRSSALKGRVSRAYLISHYQSRLCFPYRRMSQTGWQIFSVVWEYLLFIYKVWRSENRGGTTIFVYSSPAQECCLRRGFYISLGIKISESQDGGKGEYYEKNEWIWNDGKKRNSSSE